MLIFNRYTFLKPFIFVVQSNLKFKYLTSEPFFTITYSKYTPVCRFHLLHSTNILITCVLAVAVAVNKELRLNVPYSQNPPVLLA